MKHPCTNCMKDKEFRDGAGNYRCHDCPLILVLPPLQKIPASGDALAKPPPKKEK